MVVVLPFRRGISENVWCTRSSRVMSPFRPTVRFTDVSVNCLVEDGLRPHREVVGSGRGSRHSRSCPSPNDFSTVQTSFVHWGLVPLRKRHSFDTPSCLPQVPYQFFVSPLRSRSPDRWRDVRPSPFTVLSTSVGTISWHPICELGEFHI